MSEARQTPRRLPVVNGSRVLLRAGAFCVVNKLPGESSESPFVLEDGSSWTAAHRLDVPVSGCLLLAPLSGGGSSGKNPGGKSLSFLSAAFARPPGEGALVEKRYWAVAENPPSAFTFDQAGEWTELSHWILTDTKRNKSIAYAEKKPGAKKALLRYRLAGRGDNYLFLEIDLLTGRHHQIRAQLAKEGLRIKGDLKYGARRSERGGGIRLHAAALAFPDPENTGEQVRVSAFPPVSDALWEAFRASVSPPGA
jgi:23S rRNA pseudouridine1911/1915/1917 synthase